MLLNFSDYISSQQVFGIILGVLVIAGIIGFFLYFLLRNTLFATKRTENCRIVSFVTAQTDDTRNFATLPNLASTNIDKKNVGFVPDLSAYVVVELLESAPGKLKKLHCNATLLQGIGKVGDTVRITYKGNHLLSSERGQ